MQKRKVKKSGTIYKEIEFDFNKLFPCGRNLGNQILRLMAALNDILFIRECFRTQQPPKGSHSPKKAFYAGKTAFLVRLMCAVQQESLEVVKNISTSKEYKEHADYISKDGKDSLIRLLDFKKGDTGKIFKKVRDKATFHYDRGFSTEGVVSIRKTFKGENKTAIIKVEMVERKNRKSELSKGSSFYFLFADAVRSEFTLGPLGSASIEDIVSAQLKIEKYLHIFFCSLFNAYQEKGNICAFDGNDFLLYPI